MKPVRKLGEGPSFQVISGKKKSWKLRLPSLYLVIMRVVLCCPQLVIATFYISTTYAYTCSRTLGIKRKELERSTRST